ncbi:MAG: sigma-70 family RNA polymerase sigma factor [Tannerella sp.]|jgi:RNA polymerase sigma factor (sigma-70 family)|nr:sigma-70 family RNA polymerase sigma factor [Tannerella sp.]
MTEKELEYYSGLMDRQLLEKIYSGDKKAETYLFCVKCVSVINYCMRKFFDNQQMQLDEAVNEIYIYIKKDNWYKLRQYGGRNNASIKTWISTVAYNFFLNLHKKMNAEMQKKVNLPEPCNDESEQNKQIRKALFGMPNDRYKIILIKMYYENKTREKVAEEMNVSIDYFYVLYRRAKEQFKEQFNKYYKVNETTNSYGE